MIKAFSYGIEEKHINLIKKMALVLSNDPIEVIDIRSFTPEVSAKDIVLVYGMRTQNALKNIKCRIKVEFEELTKLDPATGDQEERQWALRKLIKLRETLDSATENELLITKADQPTQKTLKLTEELPTQLTATVVKELEKQQREQGKVHWNGCTVDGRSIRVTVEPENDTADINLTFAELYAVMGLKEAFRVKELEFVYKPSVTTRKSGSK